MYLNTGHILARFIKARTPSAPIKFPDICILSTSILDRQSANTIAPLEDIYRYSINISIVLSNNILTLLLHKLIDLSDLQQDNPSVSSLTALSPSLLYARLS